MKRYKSDLDFLENYWKDAKTIADKIKNEMPSGSADVPQVYLVADLKAQTFKLVIT